MTLLEILKHQNRIVTNKYGVCDNCKNIDKKYFKCIDDCHNIHAFAITDELHIIKDTNSDNIRIS